MSWLLVAMKLEVQVLYPGWQCVIASQRLWTVAAGVLGILKTSILRRFWKMALDIN